MTNHRTKRPVVAFLGIGLMGNHMARNLLRAGFVVHLWNRTKEKAEALIADGGIVHDTAIQAVTDADVIITMLSDGPTVASLLFSNNVIDALSSGAIVIDMSSIKATEARAHAERLSEKGVGHLDAPVSGGTKGAEMASLAIMVGGHRPDFDRAVSVLSAMGRPTYVGPSGAGQLSKLANQAIVGVTIGVVAEAMLFVEKGGADPAAMRDALVGGFADSTILQQHGKRMTTGDFVPGGPAKFQLKDMTNVLDEAAEMGIELPMTRSLRDRFSYLVETLDGGDLDHSALYLELLEQNGLSDS